MFQTKIGKIGLWAVLALGVMLHPLPAISEPLAIQATLDSGVVLKVYLAEEEDLAYARKVLEAACAAYREVVFAQGFSRPGYTFAVSTRDFAYDRDKTIDIYIADTEAPFALMTPVNSLEYKARIFVPADYKKYRHRYNIKNPELELKASLTHELFHIVTYSYNRNMQTVAQGKTSLTDKSWDWYNEGLARYFEALVGYRDEFLSSGFRKKVGAKTLVYKGGVNYFLKYPNRPLGERKYDFALFWQYLHQNYGMDKIEEISSRFREIDPQSYTNQQAMEIIAQTLDLSLPKLISDFSLYVYKASSLPTGIENGLSPVAISKIFTLKNERASIASFGYCFYEIDLRRRPHTVQVQALNGRKGLNCVMGIRAPACFSYVHVQPDSSGEISIDAANIAPNSKLIIMLSNPTDQVIPYRLFLN